MSSWPPRGKMGFKHPNMHNKFRYKMQNKKSKDEFDMDPAIINQLTGFIRPITITGNVKICKIKDIDWSTQNQIRAGVIPHVRKTDKRYFNLGKDAKFNSLTDCGGGKNNGDINSLYTAMREWKEESCNIFGYEDPDVLISIDKDHLDNSICIMNDDMLIIMIELDPDIDMKNIEDEFTHRSQIELNSENSNLVWLDHTTFYKAIMDRNGPKMYILVRMLLSRVLDELYQQLDINVM